MSLDRLKAALADRYRIERELGAGGMATVYLAQDLKHDRKVALKVLKPELAAVIGAERFLVEIKTTAALQHPNILPLFDSGSATVGRRGSPVTGPEGSGDLGEEETRDPGPVTFLYYVMPYIEGETLRGKLDRETQFGIDEAVKITVAVADALDYAHRHGVIHRDIKPENILMHDGRPIVADFGIALALSAAAGGRMTETGMSLGTPHYMSPEQATADKEITGRSDIYSLGSVLYEMLAGEPPHIGHSAQQIIMKIIAEEVQPVTKHRKAVPPNVAAAVAKSLERLPADRFATAKEFADALTNRGFSTIATGAAALSASPSIRRSAPLYAALVLVAALAVWGWFRPAPSKQVIRYSMGFAPDQSMSQGLTGVNLAVSPDGKWLVYVGAAASGGRLLLRARDQLDAVPIPGTEGAANPFFSPDGTRIAYLAGANSSLTVVSVAGGPPIVLDKGAPGSAGGGAWGSDGWIYFDTPSGTARIRADGGTPELLIPYDTAARDIGFAWTDALPNRKGLIFRARRNLDPSDFDIQAFDLRTHARHFLIKGILARYVEPGYLLIVRADGAVLVAPFDAEKLALTGPAVPLLSGVMNKAFGSVDLTVSRTGTLFYVPGAAGTSGGYAELIQVDRAGHITPFDPSITLNPSTSRGLSLSPDGRRLALDQIGTSSPDIWVKQLPSGAFSRLTFDSVAAVRPQWSADGRDILYRSQSGSRPSLWRVRADGSSAPHLIWKDPRANLFAFSLSRDGQWLVYRTSEASGDRDIYAVHLGHDTVATPLLNSTALEDAPALSPDGRWLAYTSNESGRNEIYVRPFPNVNDGRWQISTTGGEAARWASSGRELFFEGQNSDLLSVSVTPGTTFVPGAPQKILDGTLGYAPSVVVPYYDITPDGKRFLMVRLYSQNLGTGGGHVVVVENWTTEVFARMKAH